LSSGGNESKTGETNTAGVVNDSGMPDYATQTTGGLTTVVISTTGVR